MNIKKTQLKYVICRLNSYQTPVYKFSMPSVLVQKGACDHVIASLYKVVEFKMLNYLAIFEDGVCTSKPQTWHKPRDDKIKSLEIQSLEVGSYKKHKVMTESMKEMSSKYLKSIV